MFKQEEISKIKVDLVDETSTGDCMIAFRRNIDAYLALKGVTLQDVSDTSGVPMSTLKSFIYGDNHDVKLSTAIKLAKAFGISVDELVGCNTLNDNTKKCIQISRDLPQSFKNYITWAIKFYNEESGRSYRYDKTITVLVPEYQFGNVKMSNEIYIKEVNNIPSDVIAKSFVGFEMICDNYMPKYSQGDILMVANDRQPYPNENSIIYINGNLFLARRRIEGEIAKYYSIRDDKFRLNEEDVDEVLGYVCYTVKQ